MDVLVPKSLRWFRLVSKAFKKLFQYFGNHSIDLTRTSFYSKNIGKEIAAYVQDTKPDVIIGVAASIELAHVETDIPIVHISDATFAAMINYYPEFSKVWKLLESEGNKIEKLTLSRARAVICSSNWARKSAIEYYGVSSSKAFAIPFGANVPNLPDLSDAMLEQKFHGTCKLLFVGKDWQRKGGEIALEVFRKLRQLQVDAEIIIVNDQARVEPEEGVTVHGSIDKSTVQGLSLFCQLFEEASFFVLPTQAEAFGLVYAEAAAYGCIAVGPETGGVPDIIDDDVTGILMPETATVDEYANRIAELWKNKKKLEQISKAARNKFDDQLSWSNWGAQVSEVVSKKLQK